MPQIKIAHVVCTYPPYHGGMGRVAFEYTERLRARGYNVHVFTSREDRPLPTSPCKGEENEVDPEYVHRVPAILSVGNASVLPSLFQRLSGFDLVHLHYPFYGGAEPVIVRKALKPNQGLVMTYHMDAIAGGIRGAIFEAHKRLMFPWIANRADRILVSSREYADTSALKDIPGIMDRVEIHPFGVDLEKFHPGSDDALRESLLTSPPLQGGGREGVRTIPILLFVGGLDEAHHFKGLPVLFESLKELKHLSWHLVIVGEGNLRATYEALVRMHEIEKHVTFAGGVSNDELPRYFRMADIHVFPSTKRAEAFGLVALEAAASGIPSIASDLPGVRSVVLDGETGLRVPVEDVNALKEAIELLLTRKDVREQFGQSARSYAETTFAWEPLITNLEETYRSVLAQQSPRDYQTPV